MPQPDVVKDYGFKVRTVPRPRCSREELRAEFQRWQEARGNPKNA